LTCRAYTFSSPGSCSTDASNLPVTSSTWLKDVLMGLMEKMVRQCRKPKGFLGRFVGIGMNTGHSKLRRWGLSHISINPDAYILDVGCGGGKAVRELAQISSNGKVCGIDYSEEMVKLARKINKKFVENGHVEIMHCSVSSLPFPDGTFNLVTAFETYYFWQNLIDDLKEIKRVLKPDGTLLITNEVYKHEKFEKRNLKWAEWGDMMLHAPEEYREFLTEAGYLDVAIFDIPEKNWITALAKKG
jgi:ubiquinone/menaquinone biosynthesis C-methylase UbiE